MGHDVWVGSLAIIKAGVKIGTGAIVAGGAVVVKDVEPYSIVGGVPAKHIRHRFDPETVQRLLASEWWNLSPDVLSGIPFDNIGKALDMIEALEDPAKY